MEAAKALNHWDLFESVSQPIIIADSHLLPCFVNDSVKKLLKLNPKEDPQNLIELLQIPSERLKGIQNFVKNKATCKHHLEYLHPDGSKTQLELHFKPLSYTSLTDTHVLIEICSEPSEGLSTEQLQQMGKRFGEITHDFANPLSILKVSCENILLTAEKQRLWTSKEITNKVQKLSDATERLRLKSEELAALSKVMTNLDWENLFQFLDEEAANTPSDPEFFDH